MRFTTAMARPACACLLRTRPDSFTTTIIQSYTYMNLMHMCPDSFTITILQSPSLIPVEGTTLIPRMQACHASALTTPTLPATIFFCFQANSFVSKPLYSTRTILLYRSTSGPRVRALFIGANSGRRHSPRPPFPPLAAAGRLFRHGLV